MKTPYSHRYISTYLAAVIVICLQGVPALRAQFVVVHSGNVLANPAASSGSVAPWVPTGTWMVHNGADLIDHGTINCCDNSKWFLSYVNIGKSPCGFQCSSSTATSISQTVSVSNYATAIQNKAPHLNYGGDAFAAIKHVTNLCTQIGCHGSAFEADFRVDFLNSSNAVLAHDDSGPIFHTNVACIFGYNSKKQCGFRRTVNTIPTGTVSIRFTATMTDVLTICDNPATTFMYTNGFDNLFAELVYTDNTSDHNQSGRVKKSPKR